MDISYQDLELEMIMNNNKRSKKSERKDSLNKIMSKCFQILEQRLNNNASITDNPDRFISLFDAKVKDMLSELNINNES